MSYQSGKEKTLPFRKIHEPEPETWAEKWFRQMTRFKAARRNRCGHCNSRKFWDDFDLWESYEPYTRYPGKLLAPILSRVDAETTVLDVGSGSGALALPMAAAAGRVTAVEPSSAQCGRLKRKIGELGAENVTVVEKTWEDVAPEALGCHDIVTAGYCLFMADIKSALLKMRGLARHRIFLVHPADHDLVAIMGEIRGNRASFPDHHMLLNLFHEMGWEVQSRLFARHFDLPLALQMSMFRYAQGFDSWEIGRIEAFLRDTGRVFMRRDEAWVRRRYVDALLSSSAERS